VTGAVLQRDAPLPARLTRGRPGVRSQRIGPRARHGHRPVARQPVAPVLVTRFQSLFDEECAEAGTVDEKIGLNRLAAFKSDRSDVAIVVLLYVNDLAFGAPDPVLFGQAAQIFGVEGRI